MRRGHQIHPTFTLDVCSHTLDNRILECAFAARADYLVTVNIRHFPASFYGIKTLQPHQFYDVLFLPTGRPAQEASAEKMRCLRLSPYVQRRQQV